MTAKKVLLSDKDREVLWAALSFYRDTLTKCVTHDRGHHGDESECDGWGPKDLKALDKAIDKVS